MKLYPSDPDFPAINELQFRLMRLTNRHMHPWDSDAVLPAVEAEAMRREILDDLRVLIED